MALGPDRPRTTEELIEEVIAKIHRGLAYPGPVNITITLGRTDRQTGYPLPPRVRYFEL